MVIKMVLFRGCSLLTFYAGQHTNISVLIYICGEVFPQTFFFSRSNLILVQGLYEPTTLLSIMTHFRYVSLSISPSGLPLERWILEQCFKAIPIVQLKVQPKAPDCHHLRTKIKQSFFILLSFIAPRKREGTMGRHRDHGDLSKCFCNLTYAQH